MASSRQISGLIKLTFGFGNILKTTLSMEAHRGLLAKAVFTK